MLFQKISIYFAIKELSMHVYHNTSYQNAALLFYANIARLALAKHNNLQEAIDNPLTIEKRDLEVIFSLIQDMYMDHVQKAKLLKQQFNPDKNEYKNIIEPYEKCYLIWLGTIGAEISQSRLNEMNDIWQKLIAAIQYISIVIEREAETDYMLGQNFINENNKLELLQLASYVPSIFKATTS